MRMRLHRASKAGRIWDYPSSVGRKPRRAHGLANLLASDRAGFEPRRGSSFAHEYARPQTLGSERFRQMSPKRSGSNPARSRRFEIATILGAPRFSPYRPTHHPLA
jgi:hypothetical protein